MDSQHVQHIWKEYGSQLRGFLKRRVSNSEDAEDLLQEIILKTHQHMKTLKDPDKIYAWLFQVARNTLTDLPLVLFGTYLSSLPLPPLPDIFPAAVAKKVEGIESVLNAPMFRQPVYLPKLRRIRKYRRGGRLRCFCGNGLGLSHSAIKSRVQRGRQMLRELFRNCCSFELDVRRNVIDYERKSECC